MWHFTTGNWFCSSCGSAGHEPKRLERRTEWRPGRPLALMGGHWFDETKWPIGTCRYHFVQGLLASEKKHLSTLKFPQLKLRSKGAVDRFYFFPFLTQWIPGKPLCKEPGFRSVYAFSLWNHWLPTILVTGLPGLYMCDTFQNPPCGGAHQEPDALHHGVGGAQLAVSTTWETHD